MRIERLSGEIDIRDHLKQLDVDAGGLNILASKARQHLFHLRDMHVGAANILKQDALSVGADLAVPKNTILGKPERVDAILMGTERQLLALCKKEQPQPFGLKAMAAELKRHLKAHTPKQVQIMGVINANEDSFFSGSRFSDTAAVEAIEKMMGEGADIIDIGGVSSRPGSDAVTAQEELRRVKPVIDALYAQKLYEKVRFSIDSYAPEVISYALERGFGIVNDITGLRNDEVCRLSAEYGATAVAMHMQGTPKTMQANPEYGSLLGDISAFFEELLQKAERFGIKEVVLDVGIGFGKTLEHNLALIAQLEHFLALGAPLLVGASRKSMIDQIITTPVEERLPGTLAIHLKAVENGAQIIRCHDVKAHKQALEVARALKNG